MLTARNKTWNLKIGSIQALLHEWIYVEVPHALLEELTSFMGRIIERLAVRFKEHIMDIRTDREVLRTTQEGELGLGTQLEKIKHEQYPTLPTITKELDGTMPRVSRRLAHRTTSSMEGADKRALNVKIAC